MEYKKVFYSHGVPLNVVFEFPGETPETAKKYPVIILCHGHSRHKNDGLDVLSHMLAQKGYMTARLDFRGCGRSSTRRHYLYCASEWPGDLVSLINYIEGLGIADMSRFGVAGISMGACTVVYTAGIDKRIKSVVSMSGIGDCYTWLKYVWDYENGDFEDFVKSVYEQAAAEAATGESRMCNVLEMYHYPADELAAKIVDDFSDPDSNSYVAWSCLQELLLYKPIIQCPNVTQPIFFLTGGDDDLVPGTQSEDMYNAVRSEKKQIKRYPGVEHNIPIDPQREMIFSDIIEWFGATM